MFDMLWNQAQASLTNQFLSGGLILMILGSAIAMTRKLPMKLWHWFLRYFTVTLDVSSDDSAYYRIIFWLNTLAYTKRARRLSVKIIGDGAGNAKTVLIPSRGTHWFIWEGRPVWLSRNKEEGNKGSGPSSDIAALLNMERITIRLVGRSQKPIERILMEADRLYNQVEEGYLKMYLRVGGWDSNWRRNLVIPRKYETVFWPISAQSLLDDMKYFLENKGWYRDRGIPYRRGYLFHGPPGTGKSTASAVLTYTLGLPLYVFNLATVPDDSRLEQAFNGIDTTKPAVLLIEDIDTIVPDREHDKSKKTFSLGTLLNSMDGVAAKENLILILTTNHRDRLDEALLRPGRIDRQIEFDYATDEQIITAIKLFFKEDQNKAISEMCKWERPITMATVQEHLRNLAHKGLK